MSIFFSTTNPSDVREIDDETIAAWEVSGNPKLNFWAEQPAQPSPDAAWVDGEWVIPPPPEPTPDWPRFKRIALGSDTLKSIAIAAYPSEPIAAGALSASLYEAEKGNIADFAGAWKLVCVAANVTPEVVTGFVGVAQACNLPAEFVAALSPE